MTCERMQEILDAYLDGEMPAPDVREVEEHLHECAACAGALASRKALQNALRTKLTYHRAPAGTSARMFGEAADSLGTVAIQRHEPAAASESPVYTARSAAWWRRTALSLAACFALVCTAFIALLAAHKNQPEPSVGWAVQQLVLSNHLRSLEGVTLAVTDPSTLTAGHLIDVVSSDRHTVRPWFAGKLPFAPPVPELEGFTLVGGRLDMVLDQPAAAIVYRRDRHLINLLVWPRAKFNSSVQTMSPTPHEVAGYHEVEFVVQGFTCWAVSDVEGEQLMNFARAYQKAASEGAQANH